MFVTKNDMPLIQKMVSFFFNWVFPFNVC